MRLLERDEPLAVLAGDLAEARRGDGRVVLVAGEAGIGKTSLVERFVDGGEIGRVLWGACEAWSTPQPLGPLHDAARSATGPWKAMLTDGADRAALFAAVLDALAVPPAPTVFVVEDVHWADAATLDLVRYLGRRIHRLPAMLILTYRDDAFDASPLLQAVFGALPARHVTRIALSRLSPAAVRALAAHGGRDAVDVHAVTGGNPFFVTEVLAHDGHGVPATVRDAVVARLACLDDAARDVLDLAALVPRAIDASLIARVLSPSSDAIDACIAGGLLIADGDARRFRHELARVAIETAMPSSKARALHARILAALTGDDGEATADLARLVHHAQAAGDGDAVLRFAPRAAREAAARGARREAAAHDRAALARAADLPDADRAALLEHYAAQCFELNDLAAAIPAREEAIALFDRIGDRAACAAALAAHAMPLVRALRNADADDASRRALELASSLPSGPLHARTRSIEAYLRMLNRDYRDAIAWGEQAIVLAECHDDRETLAAAHTVVGAARLFVDFPRGVAMLRQSMAIARTLPDGSAAVADAMMMLGTASGELYRLDEAEQHLDEGIAFARAHDLDRLAGYMAAWQALVDVLRGRWGIAGERANALIAREVAGSTNRVMALVALGRLRSRRGDPGVDAALDEALDLASRSGTLQRVAPVRAARAEVAWLRGDPDAVRREATAVYALAIAKDHPWHIGELAFWRWRAGCVDARPSRCAEPFALQIDGHWADAAAAWAALGCPYEQARALADGDEAAQRQALVILHRLQAAPMAERVRASLQAAGAAAVPRGPRASTRGNGAGLTMREIQILSMVAEGASNVAIAASLSRSPRTIEHHVAAILAKLGAAGRVEAVTIARDRGLLSQDE